MVEWAGVGHQWQRFDKGCLKALPIAMILSSARTIRGLEISSSLWPLPIDKGKCDAQKIKPFGK